MKRIITSEFQSSDKPCRQFANDICGSLLEDYGLHAGFTIGRSAVQFTVYRDESMQSVHCTYSVDCDLILDMQSNWEERADFQDDTVNKIARKASRAL